MALTISSTLNSTSNPTPLTCLSSQRKPPTTTLTFYSKLKLSKICISKNLTLNNSSNTHNENKITRTKSSSSSSIPVLEPESYSELASESRRPHRIWWSNVEVKWPKNVFVGRKLNEWNSLDIVNLSWMIFMHGLALFAPFTFNWGAFWVAVVLWFVTGMFGLNLSYHRNLTHKSFKLPKWLEYFFAYCGLLGLQRDPIYWVSIHRFHHRYVDSKQDPHSPLEGFWFSQINWLFDHGTITEKCGEPSNVQDLEKQPFYKFMRSTYWMHILLQGILLYTLGGFPYLVWGLGVRGVWLYQTIGLVNSSCHLWGKQAWNTNDLSKNNWLVALLTFGEGWHNNHHAFEYSARQGLEWWQIDMTWYIVKLLQHVGLTTDVKLPTKEHKQCLTFQSE